MEDVGMRCSSFIKIFSFFISIKEELHYNQTMLQHQRRRQRVLSICHRRRYSNNREYSGETSGYQQHQRHQQQQLQHHHHHQHHQQQQQETLSLRAKYAKYAHLPVQQALRPPHRLTPTKRLPAEDQRPASVLSFREAIDRNDMTAAWMIYKSLYRVRIMALTEEQNVSSSSSQSSDKELLLVHLHPEDHSTMLSLCATSFNPQEAGNWSRRIFHNLQMTPGLYPDVRDFNMLMTGKRENYFSTFSYGLHSFLYIIL